MSTIVQVHWWLLLLVLACVPVAAAVFGYIGFCHGRERTEEDGWRAIEAAPRPPRITALMELPPPPIETLREMWAAAGPETSIIDHRAIEPPRVGEHERRLLMAPIGIPDNRLKPFPVVDTPVPTRDFDCCAKPVGQAPAADDPSLVTAWTAELAARMDKFIAGLTAEGPGGGVTGESARSGQPPDVVQGVSGVDTGGGLPEREPPADRVRGLRVVPLVRDRPDQQSGGR